MRWHVRRKKKHSYLFTKAKKSIKWKKMYFFVVIWWVECVRALAIDSKSLRDKSHSIKNRNTNFLVARIKKNHLKKLHSNILLYFVAISTFITHFTFTSSEFHYSPANYNKKMYYKQNEKHLQHSAANKKHRIILSKEIRMKTSKRRRSEKKDIDATEKITKYPAYVLCFVWVWRACIDEKKEAASAL